MVSCQQLRYIPVGWSGPVEGDEFCVLASVPDDRAGAVTAAASLALTDHGGGFSITASYGSILLPEESQDVTEAMQLVDQRMYAQKTSGRRSPDRLSRDVLLRAPQERNPELAERHAAVAGLVDAVTDRLVCRPTSASRPGRRPSCMTSARSVSPRHPAQAGPARPRGVGVHPPPPADRGADHRRRRRPGGRGQAGPLHPRTPGRQRLSRWAGRGPDPPGGAGDRRVRCLHGHDAPRPYAPQLTVAQALGELRQGAGSQFDPMVVDALSELAVELIWATEAAEDPDKIQASHHPA